MLTDGPWFVIRPPDADYVIRVLVGADELDAEDDNVDVEVKRGDGTRWGATFFTPRNVQRLFEKNAVTGECDGGLWFTCPDMVLVRRLGSEEIQKTVEALLREGIFESAFMPLDRP
jgi:hypothetical protein